MNRWAIAGCVALGCAGAVAAGMTRAEARGGRAARTGYTKDLVVTLVTPTLNQEVLSDLADPGLNGVITVRFSSPPRRNDIIDNQNTVNRLTSKVEFIDATFRRLPGEPSVRRNVFTFSPLSQAQPVLPNGQYTLNIRSSVRNGRGRQLNSGLRDFTTSFSVGTDVHKPVLREISPIHRQTNIGLKQRIVATFNEPIDPASLISTITVQDNTTNPPTPIPGAGGIGVTTERNGFDVVFTPDPCFGYPPKTTIGFIMQGLDGRDAQGNPQTPSTSPVTDVFGNGFDLDSGLQWANNPAIGINFYESPNGVYDKSQGIGQFRMEFETVGVKPAPQPVAPGSPQYTAPPIATPCAPFVWFPPSCYAAGSGLHYTTANGMGQMSFLGVINRFSQGVTDLSLTSLLPNAPVRLGRPSGVVVDPRWDPTTFHGFMYVVDQRTNTILVLDSRSFKVLSRLEGFVSPRDVSISTTTNRLNTTLWVSDFASNQLVGVDAQTWTVNFGGQPGSGSPCDQIGDPRTSRVFIDVGRGPTGVSADSFLNSRVMVCNTFDNSVSLINVPQAKVINDYEVGSTPVDCDWILYFFGGAQIAMVANQGGLNDPEGSISMFVGGTGRDGIENTFSDGVKNPATVYGQQQWINGTGTSIPNRFIIPSTGGKTITEYTFAIVGGFGVAINVSPVQTYEVGLNPTSAVYDPFYPALFIFASVSGQGAVAGVEPGRTLPAVLSSVPGIRRIWTCYTH